jgi:hypothetical protein
MRVCQPPAWNLLLKEPSLVSCPPLYIQPVHSFRLYLETVLSCLCLKVSSFPKCMYMPLQQNTMNYSGFVVRALVTLCTASGESWQSLTLPECSFKRNRRTEVNCTKRHDTSQQPPSVGSLFRKYRVWISGRAQAIIWFSKISREYCI